MKKIKIIYIAGVGYSGSTLLDKLIETSDNCLSVGELMFLKLFINRYKKGEVEPNDINKRIYRFWEPIIERYPDFPRLYDYTKGLFDNFIKILLNRGGDDKINYKIFSDFLIKQKSDVEDVFIVDSSKNLNRLVDLNNNDSIDLHVIHLVRDVRGLAYSMFKRKEKNKKKGRYFLFVFIKWLIYNTLISFYLKFYFNKKKKILIGYDNFSDNILKYIGMINVRFGTKIDKNNYLDKMNEIKSNAIVGNGIRNKHIKEIKTDKLWRINLPFFQRFFLSIFGYFPNKFWLK